MQMKKYWYIQLGIEFGKLIRSGNSSQVCRELEQSSFQGSNIQQDTGWEQTQIQH
jgi:hypothetical protein